MEKQKKVATQLGKIILVLLMLFSETNAPLIALAEEIRQETPIEEKENNTETNVETTAETNTAEETTVEAAADTSENVEDTGKQSEADAEAEAEKERVAALREDIANTIENDIPGIIAEMEANKGDNFANARSVRNYFESIVANQAARIAELKDPTEKDITTITADDLNDITVSELSEKNEVTAEDMNNAADDLINSLEALADSCKNDEKEDSADEIQEEDYPDN